MSTIESMNWVVDWLLEQSASNICASLSFPIEMRNFRFLFWFLIFISSFNLERQGKTEENQGVNRLIVTVLIVEILVVWLLGGTLLDVGIDSRMPLDDSV